MENGCNESFNGKLRDELLNGEICYTLNQAELLVEQWRIHYNTVTPLLLPAAGWRLGTVPDPGAPAAH